MIEIVEEEVERLLSEDSKAEKTSYGESSPSPFPLPILLFSLSLSLSASLSRADGALPQKGTVF